MTESIMKNQIREKTISQQVPVPRKPCQQRKMAMDFSKDLGIADEISKMNERLCELDRIRIETPVTVGTYALMDKFRIKCRLSDHGKAMLIYGRTQSGTTGIAKMYCQKYASTGSQAIRSKPLFLTIPDNTTANILAESILKKQGIDCLGLSMVSKTELCGESLKRNSHRCLVIDRSETLFNDLLYGSDALYWIKYLSQKYCIPVIFIASGLINKKVKGFSFYNDFLTEYREIELIRWGSKNYGFEELMKSIDGKLPFSAPSALINSQVAKRIYVATVGNIGLVMALVKTAALLAIVEDKPTISESIIHAAFKTLVKAKILPQTWCNLQLASDFSFHP